MEAVLAVAAACKSATPRNERDRVGGGGKPNTQAPDSDPSCVGVRDERESSELRP